MNASMSGLVRDHGSLGRNLQAHGTTEPLRLHMGWLPSESQMPRLMAGILSIWLIAGTTPAQSQDGLADLSWLVGEWRGVGEGDPGTSASERHIGRQGVQAVRYQSLSED